MQGVTLPICEKLRDFAGSMHNVNRYYMTAQTVREREIQTLEAAELITELVRLLARYRNETPLGHQPHMIAHEADAVLTKAGVPTP